MPQVTITLDLPASALRDLFNSYDSPTVRVKGVVAAAPTDKELRPFTHKPGQGRGKTPKLPSPAYYYRRQKGDVEGAVPGHRRPSLNVTGMKLAWSLYNQGYSYTEIARAFKGVASVKAVTITIRNIAGSTKEV